MAARTTSITPGSKTANPLHRRPLTLNEYAGLSRDAQSKAAWLMKDHLAQLDAEMTAARAELEAEVERREAEMAELNFRRKQLVHRRSRAIKTIRVQLAEIPELRLLASSTTGMTVELREAEDAVTAYRAHLAATVAEANRLRRLTVRAEDRVKRRERELKGHLPVDDEGARHRMEADNEVAAMRARRTAALKAQRTETANAAVSA